MCDISKKISLIKKLSKTQNLRRCMVSFLHRVTKTPKPPGKKDYVGMFLLKYSSFWRRNNDDIKEQKDSMWLKKSFWIQTQVLKTCILIDLKV